MKNALLAFGAVVAIGLVAVPVVSVTLAATDVVYDAFNPSLYQLTFELDGEYYIADYNLTRADCYARLNAAKHDADSFRNGEGRYTCDRAPRLEAAK